MNLTELKKAYIGKLGKDKATNVPVVVYDAYFRVILHDIPHWPIVKVQPLNGELPYDIEPNEIEWAEQLIDLI